MKLFQIYKPILAPIIIKQTSFYSAMTQLIPIILGIENRLPNASQFVWKGVQTITRTTVVSGNRPMHLWMLIIFFTFKSKCSGANVCYDFLEHSSSRFLHQSKIISKVTFCVMVLVYINKSMVEKRRQRLSIVYLYYQSIDDDIARDWISRRRSIIWNHSIG